MKRKIGIGIGIVVVALAIIFAAIQIKKEPKEIRIGAIFPLTGDGAKYGEEAKNGIELAVEELKDTKIRMIYEDDQGTANGAVNAFNKLTAGGKIPMIIGPMYSSTALVIAPLVERKGCNSFPISIKPRINKSWRLFL